MGNGATKLEPLRLRRENEVDLRDMECGDGVTALGPAERAGEIGAACATQPQLSLTVSRIVGTYAVRSSTHSRGVVVYHEVGIYVKG